MTLKFPYGGSQLELMLTRSVGPDMAPAMGRDGATRTDSAGHPLHRVQVLATEPGREWPLRVSLWVRRPPARTIPRGTLVQPAGETTVTPWVDDRGSHPRIAYSITADTIVPATSQEADHE